MNEVVIAAEAVTFVRHILVFQYATSFRRPVSHADLMGRFGCSKATGYRYLRALRDAGVLDDANCPIRSTIGGDPEGRALLSISSQ